MKGEHRVLIAGAGVGGLETALALHAAAGDRVAITLLDRSDRFVYRPWSVTEPFTGGSPVEVDLRGLAADKGLELALGSLTAVDPDGRTVTTDSGPHDYDSLVLALGARQVGVVEGALTFGVPGSGARLGAELDRLPRGARVAYVATASSAWPLPAYELALSTRARRPDLEVLLVTAEPAALATFGPANSARVERLLTERGVEFHPHTAPVSFDVSAGALFVPMAGTLRVDAAVALPGLVGPPIPGVPRDAMGFVPVDDFGGVVGLDGVHAIGDITARPLKQGGLAAQQGDLVAVTIAGALGVAVTSEPYRPVLRAMLVTGEGPMYLRHPEVGDGDPTRSPWWPPHKIAANHLGPYLATHAELVQTSGSA